ncbi:MAG: hypothetical protein A3F63_16700 [Pseudomonadales bacterium RIFCSPHIGHO2_12_FULL_40_16]|nr:MAG: hypothetical protein A3F63_16700 [Pseudomonadales bacterium RIFCSPHIGHO2_12_FULL_40_16]
MGRRDLPYKERKSVPRQEFMQTITNILDEIQSELLNRARAFQKANTVIINSKEEFYDFFKGDGGFALAHWNGDTAIEAKIKQDLSVTIRCIPFEHDGEGKCIFSGEQSKQRVIFAKSY